MSESDSEFNFSISSDSDEDITFPDELYENLIFFLICHEPALFKISRKLTVVRDRDCPLNSP